MTYIFKEINNLVFKDIFFDYTHLTTNKSEPKPHMLAKEESS
jgi:hypothetical protein